MESHNQPNDNIDFSNNFVTAETFVNRIELIKWVRTEAKKLGFVVIIFKSNLGADRRKQTLILGCERGGSYKPYQKPLKRLDSGTKKYNCPFRLRGYFLSCGTWKLTVVNGKHNHSMSEYFEGHPYAERLKSEEKQIVDEMTSNMIPPKNILLTLKKRNAENFSTMKTVYNARFKSNKSIRGPRTEMQQLLKCLEEDKYVYKYRLVEGTETIKDIFWAHPDSVKLFNTFSTVVLMDSTYKTNKYCFPLLEFVGVTSTEMTYSIAFAFMESEKEDNVTWALQMCRVLLKSSDHAPKVVVIDRDVALMNVVSKVFGSSTHLLCRYHISKNVRARCKLDCKVTASKDRNAEKIKHSEVIDNIMCLWENIIESPSEEEYWVLLGIFKEACSCYLRFQTYVETTILNEVKEKFVRAWTDKVMHIGNTTTNRVESSHGRLKKYLTDSFGDLCRGWESMNGMIKLQHTEIEASFQKSMIVLEHRYKEKMLYSKLVGNISRSALNFISEEEKRVEDCGIQSSKCGCITRKTHGLPCACVIGRHLMHRTPLRLDEVHSHWKKLHFEDNTVPDTTAADVSILAELQAIQERFNKADNNTKLEIKEQLRQIAFPETTIVCTPSQKVITKGAPKKKRVNNLPDHLDKSTKRSPSFHEYVDVLHPDSPAKRSWSQVNSQSPSKASKKSSRLSQVNSQSNSQASKKNSSISTIPFIHELPEIMKPHIEDIVNVEGDGNCGFRVLALLPGKSVEEHINIRYDLIKELQKNRVDYVDYFGGEKRLNDIQSSLYPDGIGAQPRSKWMSFPDMGLLAAQCYRKVFVLLSKTRISETFFPLKGKPPKNPKVLCIALVHGNHFVKVDLKDGCPLPYTSPLVNTFKKAEADEWEFLLLHKMKDFHFFRPNAPIFVDLLDNDVDITAP